MNKVSQQDHRNVQRQKSHMPQNSMFFEKIVPVLLVGMGIITVALILFAAGVLLGIVHF